MALVTFGAAFLARIATLGPVFFTGFRVAAVSGNGDFIVIRAPTSNAYADRARSRLVDAAARTSRCSAARVDHAGRFQSACARAAV